MLVPEADEEIIKGLFYYFKSFVPSEPLNNKWEGLFCEKTADNLSKKSLKPYYPIYKTEKTVTLFIRRFHDIINIIIPFFDKYPVQGVKSLDYSDFKKVANIMKNKEHLIIIGIESIKEINSKMNQRRPWSNKTEISNNSPSPLSY